jgi:hypothetical protein
MSIPSIFDISFSNPNVSNVLRLGGIVASVEIHLHLLRLTFLPPFHSLFIHFLISLADYRTFPIHPVWLRCSSVGRLFQRVKDQTPHAVRSTVFALTVQHFFARGIFKRGVILSCDHVPSCGVAYESSGDLSFQFLFTERPDLNYYHDHLLLPPFVFACADHQLVVDLVFSFALSISSFVSVLF